MTISLNYGKKRQYLRLKMRKNKIIDDACTNSTVYKRHYKISVCRKVGKCSFCPWHDIENYRKRPKDDLHKKKDRKTIRKYNYLDMKFF